MLTALLGSPGEPAMPREPAAGVRRSDAFAEWWERRTAGPEDLVEVMVELEEPPAAEVYVSLRSTGAGHDPYADRAAQEHRRHLERVQERLAQSLTEPAIGAKITVRVQRLYNGIAVQAAAGKLDAIRKLPGVKAVRPLAPRYLATGSSVPWILGTRSLQTLGATGQGVNIAIIDTGIDYFHTHFGGSGAPANYTANDPTRVGEVAGVPSTKIPLGTDLVGETFNFSSANAADRMPRPDTDPFSFFNHGNAVAGIAAGLGVSLTGQTYTGPYDQSLATFPFLVDPGVAPMARIWPVKVFGSQGGTTSPAIVVLGIEWAVDPNGDGSFADAADIINISLSAPFGSEEDPDVIAAGNAAQLGATVVGVVGNTGDAYNTTGGPASHPRAISTGASIDNGFTFQIGDITNPFEIAGPLRSAFAVFGPSLPPSGISGEVVRAAPVNGCGPLTNAAAMAGRIALIDAGGCGAVDKVLNAQRAGAIAALVVQDTAGLSLFLGEPNLGPRVGIPSFLISRADAERIIPRLPGVFVSFRPDNQEAHTEFADMLADFSGRGMVGGVVRPDIVAPGTTIHSSVAGTGFDGGYLAGTSMASPHVAGVLALLVQRHPEWTPEQHKAALMNNAADLFSRTNSMPPKYGPSRVGAGRLSLQNFSESVLFYSDQPGAVGVSFGFNQVVGMQTFTERVWGQNLTGTAQNFNVRYEPITDLPGVNVSVPATLAVPANSAVAFGVQVTADAALLKNQPDPTDTPLQANNPRHSLGFESGIILLTPAAGGRRLILPVSGAFRPASILRVAQSTLNLPAAAGTTNLNLVGLHVQTGNTPPADNISMATPFEGQDISPRNPALRGRGSMADLRYVGGRGDFATAGNLANARFYVGFTTYGPWHTPNELDIRVAIDTNRDNRTDFVLQNSSLPGPLGGPSDVFIATLVNATTGNAVVQGFLNGFSAAQANTAVYHNGVGFLPLRLADLALSAADPRFNYRVQTFINGILADQSRLLSYDPTRPGLDFGTSITYSALNGTAIPVTYNRANLTANRSLGALVLHHLNRLEDGPSGDFLAISGAAP